MIWLIRLIAIAGFIFIGLAFYENWCDQIPTDEYAEEYYAGQLILCVIGGVLEFIAITIYALYKIF